MSLKPPKKSDMGKGWMRPRRDAAVKMRPEYHLIVTEGEQTEPKYFRAFCDAINKKHKGRIRLDVVGKGQNTLSLLEHARNLVRYSPNTYRYVWVVYDTDDFPPEHIDKTAALCKQYSTPDAETVFQAIWSNQCIELWFLLHFSYMHADLHRKEYWPKLSKYFESIGVGKYTKNMDNVYSILLPYVDVAISNARRLDEENSGKTPSQSKPGTKVYVLIEMLWQYLDID